MPAARAVVLRALYLSILTCFFATRLIARGTGEDRLETVDELIAEFRTNEALQILSQIVVDNPDLWDQAQERMDRLHTIEDQKIVLGEQIFEAMVSDDVDLAFELLEKLNVLDPQPNVEAEELVNDIIFTVGIIRNDNLLVDRMNRARDQLGRGEIDGALDTYLSGFDIGVSIFETTDYGETLVDVVEFARESRAEITNSVDLFTTERPEFVSSTDELKAALSSATPRDSVDSLEGPLDSAIPHFLSIDRLTS